MSKNTSNVTIGAFVVGALVLLLGMLLVMGSGSWRANRDDVVMVFDGSVKGLNRGAPVAFRGVQIGQVTDINLIFDTNQIELTTEVEAIITSDNMTVMGMDDESYIDDLIERGLRAQLLSQSMLTGLLYIQLDFHPDSELALPPVQSEYDQIPTIPSELERLSRDLESVDVERLLSEVQQSISGLNTFINNPTFQQLPADAAQTLASSQALLQQMQGQIDANIDQVDVLLDNANSTLLAVKNEVPGLAASTEQSLEKLNEAMERMSQTLEKLDYAVSDDSPTLYRMNEAVTELARAGRALQTLAQTLEQNPEALLLGRKKE